MSSPRRPSLKNFGDFTDGLVLNPFDPYMMTKIPKKQNFVILWDIFVLGCYIFLWPSLAIFEPCWVEKCPQIWKNERKKVSKEFFNKKKMWRCFENFPKLFSPRFLCLRKFFNTRRPKRVSKGHKKIRKPWGNLFQTYFVYK
jgi:hypothetical protein